MTDMATKRCSEAMRVSYSCMEKFWESTREKGCTVGGASARSFSPKNSSWP